MTSQQDIVDDPLVSALPPATDYITYLTLLEYQLTSRNLSTLNRLLSEDDGTLASEIGWDLLKLVLPMLQVVPQDANTCFAIIARRGNPREVIVRIAEELERLGQHDSSPDDSENEQDELPTFAGEATRIHLGEMKLDGMPSTSAPTTEVETTEATDTDLMPESLHAENSRSDDGLLFNALIGMLSVLHSRIKTQYPSRFLATSLPAALGAYRRLPITDDTTDAFLTLLGKLAGKQRPALPPRTSTSGSNASLLSKPSAAPTVAPPLPDPEAATEQNITAARSTDNEKAITAKLLQAVLLEVVDEYSGSLLVHDTINMQWTSRSREQFEPQKIVPGRSTIEQQWTTQPDLQERDRLMKRCLALAKDLALNIGDSLISNTAQHSLSGSPDNQMEADEEDSEFPRSPSDIPFPTSGLILLQSAAQFYQSTTQQAVPLSVALKLLGAAASMSNAHSATVTDAILALIYKAILEPEQPESKPSPSPGDVAECLNELTSVFTADSDGLTRDNAHHLATLIFHNLADLDIKLQHVVSLLRTGETQSSPVISLQSGNLKAIAVKWFKDEFLACTSSTVASNTIRGQENVRHLDPSILLLNDAELISLLFPTLPSIPGPFVSSHPSAVVGSHHQGSLNMSSEEDLETFLIQIPFFIASLNLSTILSSISTDHGRESEGHDQNSAAQETTQHSHNVDDSVVTTTPGLLQAVVSFVQTLKGWQVGLHALLEAKHKQNQATADESSGPIQLSDLYALEDALRRAKAVLPRVDEVQ